jgi:hypothetical protein
MRRPAPGPDLDREYCGKPLVKAMIARLPNRLTVNKTALRADLHWCRGCVVHSAGRVGLTCGIPGATMALTHFAR